MLVYSNLHGDGTLTIYGQLHIRGPFVSTVNISEVDIQNVGELHVDWVTDREWFEKGVTSPYNSPQRFYFGYEIELATEEVSIVVPSTKGTVVLDHEAHQYYVDVIAKRMSVLTGGCTAFEGTGYWVSQTQSLVKEKVSVLTSYTNITPKIKDELKRIALWLVRELQQEAVLIKLNRQSYLIYSLTII
eukprot:TRINITY_DN1680_c0_g1_i1.p1 TRINITY_DN1680_c0_g1~~TRINITY_DN1680_c0_g1_i1.p1  ORF type:complete len:188 (+),score=26.44 TRINITY_DN1680_c0_g1_i1:568-1131(+)